MRRLQTALQRYAWGKPGSTSKVAQLKKADCSNFEVDEAETYAELWMGTHPNGPSRITHHSDHDFQCWPTVDGPVDVPGMFLIELLETHPHYLGSQEDIGDLPFMFKVLSINKALSIQAHPDKKLAERLYATRPDLYKDDNHKPEMAVALSDFEGLCGFRPFREIVRNLKVYPELRAVIGADATAQAFACTSGVMAEEQQALRTLFQAFVTATNELVKVQVNALVERLKSETPSTSPPDSPARNLDCGEAVCLPPILDERNEHHVRASRDEYGHGGHGGTSSSISTRERVDRSFHHHLDGARDGYRSGRRGGRKPRHRHGLGHASIELLEGEVIDKEGGMTIPCKQKSHHVQLDTDGGSDDTVEGTTDNEDVHNEDEVNGVLPACPRESGLTDSPQASVTGRRSPECAFRRRGWSSSALSFSDLHGRRAAREDRALRSVILRLSGEYPDDIGIMMPLLLNYLRMAKGESFFMAANEPHAYLKGDILEVMARSDNVVRVALTPKYRDVPLLCEILTYNMGAPPIVTPIPVDAYCARYTPPIKDFEMLDIQIPPNGEYVVACSPVAALAIVMGGSGHASDGLGRQRLWKGMTFFVAANTQVAYNSTGKEELWVCLARSNLSLGI